MAKQKLPPDDDVLRFYASGMGPSEIGKLYGCQPAAVQKVVRRHDASRSRSEAAALTWERGRVPARPWFGKKQPAEMVAARVAKLTGEGNGRWKDGSERRGYRSKVKKERCEKCGTTADLVIHHRNDDHFDNAPENLAVLCASCHQCHHKTAWWAAKKAGLPLPKSNAPMRWAT